MGLLRHAFQRIKVDGNLVLSETAFRVREQLEDQTTNVAEFTIADKSGAGKYARGKSVRVDHIRIQDAHGGAHTMRRIFTGIVDKVDGTSYPNEVAVTATGQLARLRITFDEDDNLSGMSDRDAARHILDRCGITFTNSDVEGATYVLGRVQDVVWTAGQSGAEMLSELDRVFAYATIENGDGRVARIKYSHVPQDYRDNNIPERRTFRRGDETVTFYDNQRSRGDIASVVNHWTVTGLEYTVDSNKDPSGDALSSSATQGCSRRIWAEASHPNHKLLGNGVEITQDFSSDLIQSPGLAKQIARRLMRWYNRETDTLRVECGEDSRITVGTLIAVKDNAMGVDLDRITRYVVTDIQREGDFMTLDGIGGDPGDEGTVRGGIEECCGSWESDGTCTPNQQDNTTAPETPETPPTDPPPVDDLSCDPIADVTCHPPVDGQDPGTNPDGGNDNYDDPGLGTTPPPPPPIPPGEPPPPYDGCTPVPIPPPSTGANIFRNWAGTIWGGTLPTETWTPVYFEDGSLSHYACANLLCEGAINLENVVAAAKVQAHDVNFAAPLNAVIEGEFRFRRESGCQCHFTLTSYPFVSSDAALGTSVAIADLYADGFGSTDYGATLATETSPVGGLMFTDVVHYICPPVPSSPGTQQPNGTFNFKGKTYEGSASFGPDEGWHTFKVWFDEVHIPHRLYLTVDDFTEYVENVKFGVASDGYTICVNLATTEDCDERHPGGHKITLRASCLGYSDCGDTGSTTYDYDAEHPTVDIRNIKVQGQLVGQPEGVPTDSGLGDGTCEPSDGYVPGAHNSGAVTQFEMNLCDAEATVTQLPGGSFSHSDCDCYDFGIPDGTPIYPIAPGTISAADDSDDTGTYGYFVDVDTTYGTIRYAHLSAIMVHVGQDIDMDTRIGTSGHTGMIFGSPVSPHLHLQLSGAPPFSGLLDDAMTAEGVLIPDSRRALDATITCTTPADDLG